jgi:hypothetical protein
MVRLVDNAAHATGILTERSFWYINDVIGYHPR